MIIWVSTVPIVSHDACDSTRLALPHNATWETDAGSTVPSPALVTPVKLVAVPPVYFAISWFDLDLPKLKSEDDDCTVMALNRVRKPLLGNPVVDATFSVPAGDPTT